MNKENENKLIDSPVVTAHYSQHTGEPLNEIEIEGVLLEEKAVLAMASEKVRNRMLSISAKAKEIQDENSAIKNKNYELQKAMNELNKKLSSFDSEVEKKAESMLKELERKRYKCAVGDLIYIITKVGNYEEKTCEHCGGKHKVYIDGKEFFCHKCDANGKSRKYVYTPTIRKVKVIETAAEVYLSDSQFASKNKIVYEYYIGNKKDYSMVRDEDIIFLNLEDAENWLKDHNLKTEIKQLKK